jgi:hypothetical protein
MDKVSSLRLTDHNDCDRYLSEFSLPRSQFAKMGVVYTELQAIYTLIKGLPTQGSWISFTQITNTYVGEWVRSEARKNPTDRELPNALWENLVSRLSQECLHLLTIANICQPIKKNNPASEYAGYSSNIIIRKSLQNPNGLRCTNCHGISHDIDHCFAPNGGMAGLQEAFQNKTGQFAQPAKKSDPVVAALSSEINIHSFPSEISTRCDYSFTSIEHVLTPEEFSFVTNRGLSTLLDSGASSHIIRDAKYFWNYDSKGAKSVRTANHGTLLALGSGDCMAIVRHGNLSTRLTLRNCLHAPSTVVNLLSVGKIVSAGFGCNFENKKAIISTPRPDKHTLCEGTMVNKLFLLDVEYLPAPPYCKTQIPRSHHSLRIAKPYTTDPWSPSIEISLLQIPIISPALPASLPQVHTLCISHHDALDDPPSHPRAPTQINLEPPLLNLYPPPGLPLTCAPSMSLQPSLNGHSRVRLTLDPVRGHPISSADQLPTVAEPGRPFPAAFTSISSHRSRLSSADLGLNR